MAQFRRCVKNKGRNYEWNSEPGASKPFTYEVNKKCDWKENVEEVERIEQHGQLIKSQLYVVEIEW